jgi:hypothetical protein
LIQVKRSYEGWAYQVTQAEQGLAEIEKTQDELRHCIDEAKRLAEASQLLLDRSADHPHEEAHEESAPEPRPIPNASLR